MGRLPLAWAVVASFCISHTCSAEHMATVTGFAQAHGDYGELQGAEVIALETGKHMATTNAKGAFSFEYQVGQPLTVMFKHTGYLPSQSSTITVRPSDGEDQTNYFTYQAIPRLKMHLLKALRYLPTFSSPALKKDHCQLLVTVNNKGKTLYDTQQGKAGAKIDIHLAAPSANTEIYINGHNDTYTDSSTVSAPLDVHKCYYGTLPIFHTNPTCLYNSTTEDGGVFIANIPSSNIESNNIESNAQAQLYRIQATSPTDTFSDAYIQCNALWWQTHAPDEMMLINLSPPTGPVSRE